MNDVDQHLCENHKILLLLQYNSSVHPANAACEIHFSSLKVILGGGRMYMTPKGTPDPEYPTSNSRKGDRKDRRNLIDVWLKAKPVGFIKHSCSILPRILRHEPQIHFSSLLCFSEQEVTLCVAQEGVR